MAQPKTQPKVHPAMLHDVWTRKDGSRPAGWHAKAGTKQSVGRLSISKTAEPRIIVTCKCTAMTTGRGKQSECLRGWVFDWPKSPVDGMTIEATCPKCAKASGKASATVATTSG